LDVLKQSWLTETSLGTSGEGHAPEQRYASSYQITFILKLNKHSTLFLSLASQLLTTLALDSYFLPTWCFTVCKAQDEQDHDWILIDFFALHHFLQLANIIEQQHLCRIPIDQILQQIGVKS
jgi:hypothetical protein